MVELVGVWAVTGKRRMTNGKWGLVTSCPSCQKEVIQPRYALVKNKGCQECFVKSVYKGGNRTARHKVKYNLQINQAKKRGLELTLADEELDFFWSQPCHYCASPPSNKMTAVRKSGKVEEFIYSGLDRINNTKGYIYSNVVACCKICNHAKESMTLIEFFDWIERLYIGTHDMRNRTQK